MFDIHIIVIILATHSRSFLTLLFADFFQVLFEPAYNPSYDDTYIFYGQYIQNKKGFYIAPLSRYSRTVGPPLGSSTLFCKLMTKRINNRLRTITYI